MSDEYTAPDDKFAHHKFSEVPADQGTLEYRLSVLRGTFGDRVIDALLPVIATELQKARAEVIDWMDGEWGLGDFDQIIERARQEFAGGASL